MFENLPSFTQRQILFYVSRETIPKLEKYIALIEAWNRRTSLIQINTLEDIWQRHILDSLQLLPYTSQNDKILDIGAGAGFPGMVLAIAGIPSITLCESNMRKCVFLSEVARLTNVRLEIANTRVESLTQKYGLVISRACADLDSLLNYVFLVSRETNSRALLHKGENVNKEILNAQKNWSFSFACYPSIISTQGCILEITDLKPK